MAASIGKYLRSILYVLCILLIIVAAFFALSTRINLPGGWRFFSVITGSMEPGMKVGSLLITRAPSNESEIQKGTVISFAQPGASERTVTHRVYDIKKIAKENFFITKGDANALPDTWRVPYSSIKGIYQRQIPYLGTFFQFLQSIPGMILLVILPVLFLAWQEIRTIISILVDREVNERLGINRITPTSTGSSHMKVGAVILIVFFISQIPTAYAFIKSNPVSMPSVSLSAATALPQVTPTPTSSPTPTPTPTTTPTPTPSPTTTPTGNHLVINEAFFNVDSAHGSDCVTDPSDDTNETSNLSTDQNKNWVKNSVRVNQNGIDDQEAKMSDTVNIPFGGSTVPIKLNNWTFNSDYGKNKCHEWIELYNPTDQEINLKDWKISDDTGNAFTLNNNCPIPPRTYALIGKSSRTFEKYWPAPEHVVRLYETGRMLGDGLGNTGDRLLLINSENQLVDAITWGGDATPPHFDGAVAAGQSLTRGVSGLDTDSGADFTIAATPTPGQ